MGSIPVNIQVDGRECEVGCPFFGTDCSLFHSKIRERELYGGQTEFLRCQECLSAFRSDW